MSLPARWKDPVVVVVAMFVFVVVSSSVSLAKCWSERGTFPRTWVVLVFGVVVVVVFVVVDIDIVDIGIVGMDAAALSWKIGWNCGHLAQESWYWSRKPKAKRHCHLLPRHGRRRRTCILLLLLLLLLQLLLCDCRTLFCGSWLY
jgi:hypothetical protein